MNDPAAQIILFEWPMLTCEILAFGLACFALANFCGSGFLAGGPAIHQTDESAPATRILSILRWLTIAAIISAPFDLIRLSADMASVSFFAALPLVTEVLGQSHAGRIWIARLCVLGAMAVVVALPRNRRAQFTGVATAAGLLLILRAIASHAIDRGLVAVAFYALHEIFAALWIGSLLGLWIGFAATHEDASSWFSRGARQVSQLAAISVAIIAATGIYAAYDSIGIHLRDLVDSAWGRTLSLKLAIAAIAILIGGYNRMRLVPAIDGPDARVALRNNLTAELLVLAIVLGCSVALANTPPPH